MTDERLTAEFEEQRPHLRAVAYRMLGSVSEADNAVQEAWLRASRANTSDVGRHVRVADHRRRSVSLNMLRSRNRNGRSRSACTTGSRLQQAGRGPGLGRSHLGTSERRKRDAVPWPTALLLAGRRAEVPVRRPAWPADARG